jgi:predicted amidophosphoribosyltransferase
MQLFLLTNETVICTVCRHDIPLTNHHLNLKMKRLKNFMVVSYSSCFGIILFHKRGIVQELIHNLKYKGHEEIGAILGEWYHLKRLYYAADEIIPVPLHPRKLKERGYNQVTTFGKSLSASLNYNDSLLKQTFTQKRNQKKIYWTNRNRNYF